MPNVLKIKNPFDRTKHEIIAVKSGITLGQLRRLPEIIADDLPLDQPVKIAIDSKIIPQERWDNWIVHKKEWVMIVPRVADDDVVKVVSFITLAVVTQGWGAGLAKGIGLTGTAASWMGTAFQVGILLGGGMLINALGPGPNVPKLEFDYQEKSQSFGWNPETTQEVGICKSRIYGLVKSYGNVIEAFRVNTSDVAESGGSPQIRPWPLCLAGQKLTPIIVLRTHFIQMLYCKIGLGDGPIREPVIPGTFKINDQPQENFKYVKYRQRHGSLNQDYIKWFKKCTAEIISFIKVTNDDGPRIDETQNSDFDSLIIVVSFPKGLYDGNGASIANHTVNITIEIKRKDAEIWQELTTENITAGSTNTVSIEYDTEGTIAIERGYEYQVRLTKNTADKNSHLWGDELYLDCIKEITNEQFIHPATSLVGIKAIATDELSGSIRFSCHTRGRYLRVYNSSWSIEYNNNNAWVVYDIFTQPILAGDVSPWHYLELMLHFNDSDGATSTIDSSERGHSIIFNGTAQIDTDQKKFGTASLLLDGNSDYLTIANSGSWDLDEDNFMIAIQVRFNALPSGGAAVGFVNKYETNKRSFFFGMSEDAGSYKMRFGYSEDGTAVNDNNSETFSLSTGTWYHFCIERYDNTLTFYLDGVAKGTVDMTGICIYNADDVLTIGAHSNPAANGCYLNGWMDELQLFKDKAIYKTAFTPPTSEYTDPGHSLTVSRYDCYDPDRMDLPAFEAMAAWCGAARVNPDNFTISDISQAAQAVVTTTSKHNFAIGNIVLFRGVDNHGMVEITDETTAEVIQVLNANTFTIDLDTSGYTAFNPVSWLNIDGSHLYDFCGYSGSSWNHPIWALHGIHHWTHDVDEVHWLIVDLKNLYNVKRIRGCSGLSNDPIDIDIYVSEDGVDWGSAVASGISTWQDVSDWIEIDSTDTVGRYIKIEINDTENVNRYLTFGTELPSHKIFDVEVVQSTATVERYLPRFSFNGIIDTPGNVWDNALEVCRQCRCVPYWKGSKISVAIDKAESPVYAFTMGNTIEDSFKLMKIPSKERASRIEVHYRDESKDFERLPFIWPNADAGDPRNHVTLDLYGVTHRLMAESLADRQLKENQYVNWLCQKRVDIDAIGVLIGDVVLIQHDIANWGEIGQLSEDYTGGGLIVSAINGTNPIVIINGKIKFLDADFEGGSITYKMMVKTKGDTLETRTVIGFDGDKKITLNSQFTNLPRQGDIWAAGKQNLETKQFRVIDIKLSSIFQADILFKEYRSECYEND